MAMKYDCIHISIIFPFRYFFSRFSFRIKNRIRPNYRRWAETTVGARARGRHRRSTLLGAPFHIYILDCFIFLPAPFSIYTSGQIETKQEICRLFHLIFLFSFSIQIEDEKRKKKGEKE